MITMRILLLSALALSAGTSGAAVWTASDNTGGAIPDGSSAGLARSLVINAAGQAITNVQVNVNISATTGGTAFLGDLYAYLTNGTDLAILANRPGSRTGSPSGYSDDQSMNVSFSQLGTADFHNYRLALNGSHTIPLSGLLTGIWEADGRLVDPASVLDTSPRTAGLDVFNGDTGDGTWSLFVADMSSGATHQLSSWSLEITTIPEPSAALLAAAAALLTVRRRR
jgi:subtilisin-like proprotein convertase family protein